MVKRRSDQACGTEGGQKLVVRDEDFVGEYPLLFEYLAHRQYDDGSERETSTLLVFAADGVWKACLNDRAEGQALWVSCSFFGGVLEALERALDTSAPDWRRTSRPFKKK